MNIIINKMMNRMNRLLKFHLKLQKKNDKIRLNDKNEILKIL